MPPKLILIKIPRSQAERVTPLFLISNQQYTDQPSAFKLNLNLSSSVVIKRLRLKEFSLSLKRKAKSIQRMILRNLVHKIYKIRELHRKRLKKSKIQWKTRIIIFKTHMRIKVMVLHLKVNKAISVLRGKSERATTLLLLKLRLSQLS